MAAKKRKKVEKLAEIVGRRRPVLGSILIFTGIVLAISMLGYAPGQLTFFKEYLEPLYYTTAAEGTNICGRFGATFTLLSFVSIGAAALMIPVYLVWVGAMCLKRSAVAVSKLEILGIVGGLLLLSIIAAILQAYIQKSGQPTQFFPSGVGGRFGTFFFDTVLFPVFDKSGSLILIGTIYIICLITVFVESPIEAALELWNILKKSPRFFWRISVWLWKILIFVPKYLLNKIVERRIRAIYNPDTIENEILKKPVADTIAKAEIPFEQQPPVGEVLPVQNPPLEDIAVNIPQDAQNISTQPEPENAEANFRQDYDLDLTELEVKPADRNLDFAEDEDTLPAPPRMPERFGNDDDIPEFSQDGRAESANDSTGEETETNADLSNRANARTSAQKTSAQSVGDSGDGANELSDFKIIHTENEAYDAKPQQKKGDYIFPTIDLMREAKRVDDSIKDDYEARIKEIVNVIGQFGAKVIADKASPGPVVTRYEVRPAPGVRINRIAVLEDDIALGIRAKKVRVIAPIPGKGTVGIEVPNKIPEDVCMRDLIVSKEWHESSAEIPIALGKDVTGKPLVVDLAKMPHLLIAGTTGSGKSVCVNSIIVSMLYRMTPDDLRFIMVDPKVVELQGYNALPHMLIPVVTDIKKVPAALRWLVSEMERRYKIFKCSEVRNIAGFNAKILKDKQSQIQADELDASLTPEERIAVSVQNEEINDDTEIEIPKEKLPYIVCIVDEFADLMMTSGKEVEQAIARLTQLARAAGIHLIIATQRPSTNVITGLIKANLSTRIALRVQSQIDSRTILDHKGAETLIGRGDMLYYPGGDFIRAQGAYLTDDEIESIVNAIRVNGEPDYVDEIQSQIDADAAGDDESDEDEDDSSDPKMGEAIRLIRATKRVSTSFLQMKLGIGYGRAARIIDALETQGKIGPDKGPGKARDIFLD